tara:strand:- start:45 stop:428 length:384 start_codon:yes stop_codon:yes gene_type:complete
MNDPELFNSLTLNDNNTEFLDLPEELRQMIFNYSKIDDMKIGLTKELKYHNLMEEQGKDMVKRETLMMQATSPIMMSYREEKLINSERKYKEINDERMIMERIIYNNVRRKARIMQVRNRNHYYSLK